MSQVVRSDDSDEPLRVFRFALAMGQDPATILAHVEQRLGSEDLPAGMLPTLSRAVFDALQGVLGHREAMGELVLKVGSHTTQVRASASPLLLPHGLGVGSRTTTPSGVSAASLGQPGNTRPVQGMEWMFVPHRLFPRASVVTRCHPRETICGDAFLVHRTKARLRLVVVDGLGHGPAANEAASQAILNLTLAADKSLMDAVLSAHHAIGGTRGCTLGMVDVDLHNHTLQALTVGNVRVMMFSGGGKCWTPCGIDAILGHGRGGNGGPLDPRIESTPVPSDAILCLFSDGLSSQLRLPLQFKSVTNLPRTLFANHVTPNDDATLLMVR